MKPIRIGTRRSQLALWQTNFIHTQLQSLYPEGVIEIVGFTTQGDRVLDKALPEIGGKGLFTLELEDALRHNEIDLAVHSLKDLPTQLTDEFVIGAIPQRANPFDALVSRSSAALADLPPGAVIGTSSLRRAAQLKAYRADLQTRPIRGNVETRIRKVFEAEAEFDATVLAVAGLVRLGKQTVITQQFEPSLMLPAPGQGAIAVQCRADDSDLLNILTLLDHAETRVCVSAERAFLQYLEAGCSLPVSAYATLSDQKLHLIGRVNSLDGQKTITVEGDAPFSENLMLGIQLAQAALAQGAADLLDALLQKERLQ